MNLIIRILRKVLQRIKDNQLKRVTNTSFSLITNNCIGGVIYNDLKQEFKTPTINLYFYFPDYIRLLQRPKHYFSQKLQFKAISKYQSTKSTYPIGCLDDVEIQFLHYETEIQAEKDWQKRVVRVNYDKIFVVGSDRDCCTDLHRHEFAKLPFAKKLFFTSRPPQYPHEIYFDEYSQQSFLGDLIADDKAWYFYFDVGVWLNTGQIKSSRRNKILFKTFRYLKKNSKVSNLRIS